MRKLIAPVACALLLAGPVCFTAAADSDTGWHVAVGRLVLQGHWPRTNALSWAFGSTPWYATSWLYDVSLALMARVFPQALGPQLLTFALLVLTVVALAHACEREGSAWMVPAAALLLSPRLVARPHVASWAVLACVLWLAPRSTKGRAWSVALVALGSNLHSGAAFASAVLALVAVEQWFRTRRSVELVIAAGAGFALLANPGFLFDVRYLLEHLWRVNDVVQLQEFEPPFFGKVPAFYLLLPVTLLLAVHRRRERPAQLIATVLFAALGLRAVRMVAEATLIWAPVLSWGLGKIPRRALAVVAVTLLAGLGVRFDPRRLRPSIAWDPHLLPVRAARFLEANAIGGPGFNAFRDGGYLEMARPSVPAFIDGRVQAVPEEALLELQQVEASPGAFQAYLRRIGCEWAVTTRVRERLGGYRRLYDSSEWGLVYWDDVSEVFVRNGVSRFSDLPRYRLFHPWGHIFQGLPRAQLQPLLAEIERFRTTSPDDAFALIARCAALKLLGSPEAPAACALRVPEPLVPLYQQALSAAPLP